MGRTACTEPQCMYKGALYLALVTGAGYVVEGLHTFRSTARQYTNLHEKAGF